VAVQGRSYCWGDFDRLYPSYAQYTNAGAYTVLVTNGVDSLLSSNALLSVIKLAGWGDDAWGQIDLRSDFTNAVAISVGAWHGLALRADGGVVSWGNDFDGQSDVPRGLNDALAIAAGVITVSR